MILPRARENPPAVQDVAGLQPCALSDGLNADERRAVGFFLCRSARDLSWTFFSNKWITLSIQMGHREPALRYAMAAIGFMHKSRKPYMHTSMTTLLESNDHSQALQAYSKAMGHLRDLIDRTVTSDRVFSIDVSLLSCILFFCFDQLQSELASACLHMSTGLRLIQELKDASEGSLARGTLSEEVYSVFSGFDNGSFAILRQHQLARQRRYQLAGLTIPKIPDFFANILEITSSLDTLASVRTRITLDLVRLADEALKATEYYPSDPAVAHCVSHTLSRAVDLTLNQTISNDLQRLQKAYCDWYQSFQKSVPFVPDLSFKARAVLELQCTADLLAVQTARSPSEMIWDRLESQLSHVLDLAEHCLLQRPLSETSNSVRGVDGKLSGVGHGLALGERSRDTTTQLHALTFIYRHGTAVVRVRGRHEVKNPINEIESN